MPSNTLNVYNGKQRLTSGAELENLRMYIENTLIGPSSNFELSENGYIPWVYTEDGKVDVEKLFPDLVKQIKQTGLTIYSNGNEFTHDIKTINFAGKYVTLSVNNENGMLNVNIDDTSPLIPNGVKQFSDSIVKITNEIKNDFIIPSGDFNYYGDWKSGEIVSGINEDHLYIETESSIYASTNETWFEIIIYDANNNEYTFSTNIIDDNKVESIKNTIKVTIDNWNENDDGYSFKPFFDIDLSKILKNGGRFKIAIIHHDFANFSYVSPEYLYNKGAAPDVEKITFNVNSNSSTMYCSGLKYFTNGDINIELHNVRNLNNLAAVENKFSINFDKIKFDEKTISITNIGYKLLTDNISDWIISLPIPSNIVNVSPISGNINVSNAYCTIKKEISLNLLINSVNKVNSSTGLKEIFIDESYRSLNDPNSSLDWDSSADLSVNSLMVIPNFGLVYPFGNWVNYINNGVDYSQLSGERYYSRIFSSSFTENVKFGGIFIIEGITKANFFDERFSFNFTNDRGKTWFSLKDIRGTNISKNDKHMQGVLTNIKEIDDKLYVFWSYPGKYASLSNIFVKIGMRETSPFCIKTIQLLNLNGSEDW